MKMYLKWQLYVYPVVLFLPRKADLNSDTDVSIRGRLATGEIRK